MKNWCADPGLHFSTSHYPAVLQRTTRPERAQDRLNGPPLFGNLSIIGVRLTADYRQLNGISWVPQAPQSTISLAMLEGYSKVVRVSERRPRRSVSRLMTPVAAML